MLVNALIYICICINVVNSGHLVKRALLFQRYTILQISVGVTSPLILPRRSINLSLCFQSNFELPYNISNLFPTIVRARAYDYDLDRETFYNYVIEVLDGIGFNGEDCLLRSICEIAETPMHTDDVNSNLLESIAHYLLTPSEDYVHEDFNITVHGLYIDAENWGRIHGKCFKKYNKCSTSIVSLFTKIFFV